MVKISVIVPIYNTSQYLKKCADSLICQTLSDIEIIFVDDGSDDNPQAILQGFSDSRIKFLTQEHQGQSVARNLGLSVAKGEFIGFVDSDDWVAPDMFEKLYNAAMSAQISMCSFTIYDEKTGEMNTNDPYMNVNLFDSNTTTPVQTLDFLFRICVQPCNKIYSRKILKNIKFTPNLAFEDNLFFLQTWFKSQKISIVNEPLYFYRRNHSSTTTNDLKKLDLFEIFALMEIYLKTSPHWKKLKDYFYTHKKNTLNYWYQKITDEAVKQEFYGRMCS